MEQILPDSASYCERRHSEVVRSGRCESDRIKLWWGELWSSVDLSQLGALDWVHAKPWKADCGTVTVPHIYAPQATTHTHGCRNAHLVCKVHKRWKYKHRRTRVHAYTFNYMHDTFTSTQSLTYTLKQKHMWNDTPILILKWTHMHMYLHVCKYSHWYRADSLSEVQLCGQNWLQMPSLFYEYCATHYTALPQKPLFLSRSSAISLPSLWDTKHNRRMSLSGIFSVHASSILIQVSAGSEERLSTLALCASHPWWSISVWKASWLI